MTTFAEEVTQHLELFIKHLTDNNEVIDEYNEEFLVDATIISLKTRGTIQSHLEERLKLKVVKMIFLSNLVSTFACLYSF